MALMDENNGMIMPVSPMGGGNGLGFGGGNDLAWIILLFLIFGGNGFGRNNGIGSDGLYPWMNQSQMTSNGFERAATQNALTGIQASLTAGFGDIQNSLCNGFAGVNAAMMNNQLSNLQQMFNVQSSLQQCCCENRAATADLKYTVAAEACSDRQAISDGVQKILDQMCQDKIDAKNERIASLEQQLTAANLAAAQNAQTSRILADNAAQTVALEQYLNPVAVPAYMVPNPRCASQNFGCSCG